MGILTDLAAQRAALSPHSPALMDDGADQWLSFEQVNDRAARVATALLQAGIAPGDRVAVLAQNAAAFFILLFAAQKAGVIIAPLNWRQPVAELADVVDLVRPVAIFHDTGLAGAAGELAQAHQMRLFDLDGLADLAAGHDPCVPARIDDDAPWYLLFTSGTTGRPKAVIQTARMALANAMNVAMAVGLGPTARHLTFLPLFHTAGINLYTLPVFLFGGRSRVLAKFDEVRVLDLMRTGECTHFFGVPAIYQALSLIPGIGAQDLAGVGAFGCGGAPLAEDQMRFFAGLGAVIQGGFGMTETGPMGFLADRAAAQAKIGTVGRPQLLTEAKIAGGCASGELLLRGPTITPGYFNNPAATAQAFDPDGWLRSGDVARRDGDGDFFIIDRIKDMYISGGENVYPAEVERVLQSHDGILEAAVVGVPDAKWGEVGVAFLRANPGETLCTDGLAAWCRTQLAGYKVPVRFTVVDDFPRTASGKVRKPDLKAEAQ